MNDQPRLKGVRDVRYSEKPETDLARMAEKMTEDLPDNIRAIVMLTEAVDGAACMTHTKNYDSAEDPIEDAIVDVVMHGDAILEAATGGGACMTVMPKHLAAMFGLRERKEDDG